MPELPEVETSLRGVEPYLQGQTIKQIITRTPKLRWTISAELSQMQGAKILSLSRRAKYLILHTDKGDIIVHLGMSGSLGILEASDNLHAGKHGIRHDFTLQRPAQIWLLALGREGRQTRTFAKTWA